MDTSAPTPAQDVPDSSSVFTDQVRFSHPRRVFQTISEAIRATPFFIDEETIGLWLSTTQPELLDTGPVLMSSRDAIHIPSLEKNGTAIDPPLSTSFTLKRRKSAWTKSGGPPATGPCRPAANYSRRKF